MGNYFITLRSSTLILFNMIPKHISDKIEKWEKQFNDIFFDEMNERLNQRTLDALGKMPLFIWNGDWFAEEVHKREVYRRLIYDEVRNQLLREEAFKERVTTDISYRVVDNTGGMELFLVNIDKNVQVSDTTDDDSSTQAD